MKQKRVSKAEWLEKALEVLETDGVNGVKVDRLAKLLGISRSGFYWHFKDRKELLDDMLQYWKREYTEVVTNGKWAPEGQLPCERMKAVMKMVVENDLDRYEVPMRAWADHDPVAAKLVKDVYQIRYQFSKQIFEEMGFVGADLETRVRMWICFVTNVRAMFGKAPSNQTTEMIDHCHKVLVCQDK